MPLSRAVQSTYKPKEREMFMNIAASDEERPVELSVVIPCLNEAETIEICIGKANAALKENGIRGEIIVADNGSTDGSQEIAERTGALVVSISHKGYGAALMGGIAAARGRYVIMGDADDSYNFGDIPVFLAELRRGNELVMGNRFRGEIKPGAMPPLHRYLGNPVLSWLGRLFYHAPCNDFHCGLRAFSRASYERMGLRTTGMEFASEMIVKASLFGIRISEVPTTLSRDGRSHPPHLHTWRDGWRHLRFLLLYSPRWLFLYPGILLMATGLLVGMWLLPEPRRLGSVTFDVDTLVFAAMAILLGFQAITFAAFTKIFAISEGLLPEDPYLSRLFRYVTLEVGLLVGAVLILGGLGGSLYAVVFWARHHFGTLNSERMLRAVVPSAVALTLGVEAILSSFFMSVLGLTRK